MFRSPRYGSPGPTDFSEAFNLGAVINYIGKIGWINYFIALILITLIIAIPIAILVFGFILMGGVVLYLFNVSTGAILGFVIALILIILTLAPLFTVFQARYMTRLYDSAKIQKIIFLIKNSGNEQKSCF